MPKTPPIYRGDLKAYTEELYEFLSKERFVEEQVVPKTTLMRHRMVNESAAVDGLLMFNPTSQRPSISKNGGWVDLLDLGTIANVVYPIGSIMIRADSTNPADIFPGTTWVKTARGRAVVGQGSADGGATNRLLGDQFGADDITIATNQLPSHSHDGANINVSNVNDHSHGSGNYFTSNNGNHSHNSGNLSTSNNGDHYHWSGNYNTGNNGGHHHDLRYARSNNTARGSNFQAMINITNSTSGNVNNTNTQNAGSHSHTIYGHSGNAGAHSHNVGGTTSSTGAHSHNVGGNSSGGGSHGHTLSGNTGNTGAGGAVPVTQASIALNIWERTA